MFLLALIAILLSGVAIAALAWGIVLPRTRMAARLEQLTSYGYTAADAAPAAMAEAPARGLIASAALSIGERLADRTGRATETELRKDLLAAGFYSTSPRSLVGYRVLGALTGVVVGALLGGGAAAGVLLAILAGATGAPGRPLERRRHHPARLSEAARGGPPDPRLSAGRARSALR